MKVAAAYTGRSMSQPILLNRLYHNQEIDLHLFKDKNTVSDMFDFDYDLHSIDVDSIEIRGQTAIWLTQHRLRDRWKSYLSEHLDESFDLFIGMNDLAPPGVEVADKYGIPSLFFLRNLEVSGQEMYDSDKGYLRNFLASDFGAKVQYPFFVMNFRAYQRGMETATRVIANSEYVSQRLIKDFGVESEVIYPPISVTEYRVDPEQQNRQYIAAVNPRNREKGADIFFDIVENLPSEDFLAAGEFRDRSLEERASSLDNLTHLGYCEDMREFYRQVKLIIVPSRWNEAFGRVAAEAMLNGIPTVVSNRGGLPEVVGDTGEIVSNIDSTDAWISAIHDALDDHDPKAQMKRANRFSAEAQGNRLVEIVDDIYL